MAMLPSLELNWVRGVDKSLIVPAVAFEATVALSGYYIRPATGELEIEGRFYDKRNGVLVISSEYPESIPSTLAHEWRHHWQLHHGWAYDGIGWESPGDYDTAIFDYFTKSISEADAVKFEMLKAPAPHHDYWRSLLCSPSS